MRNYRASSLRMSETQEAISMLARRLLRCSPSSPLAMTVLAVVMAFGTISAQDTGVIDSLEAELKKDVADTTRVNLLNLLSSHNWNSNLDNSFDYADSAQVLAESIDFQRGLGIAYYCKGVVRYFQTNYSMALKYYSQSMVIKRALGDKVGEANAYITMALIYNYQGDYIIALEYLFKAVKINQEVDNQLGLASCYDNIGTLYYYQANWPLALEFYLKTIVIYQELGANDKMGGTLSNISMIYEKMHDYPKSQEYVERALEVHRKMGSIRGEAVSYAALGNLKLVEGKIEEALEYLMEALEIQKEVEDSWSILYTLNSIGTVYSRQGKYALALGVFEEAILGAKEINEHTILIDSYQYIALVYDTLGEHKQALESFKLHVHLKDSLFNEDKSKDIGKLEAKHEFETAEAERKRAEEEARILAHVQESRRNNLQYSGILIFIVLIFSAVFALGRFSIPIRLAEGLIFFSFLLFFEFTLVLLDPYIEEFSAGAPALKLGFNAVLAALIFPLHALFEEKLKGRLVN